MAKQCDPLRCAVISGGAGGLGRALSTQLIARGWHVIALDIDLQDLHPGPQLTLHQVDLTNPAELERTTAQIHRKHPSIDLVIYNAGISHIASFETLDEDAHRRVFEINYFSAVALAKRLLYPVRQARGTHLAISSVAGFSPLYHRTAYAASKHALEGFFKSLRSEEAGHGVSTLIAAPSFIATNPGGGSADAKGMVRPGSASDGMDYMSPEQAARAILKGLARKRSFSPVGRVAWAAWWINRFSPRLFQTLMERNIKGS